jgi:cation diffusion facilitator family transporter
MMSPETLDRQNLRAVNLSLAANVLLAVLKTAVGILGHSRALLADGINSTSDVIYLTIVRVFMRLAGKPPDREHPYGHRQLESIAAVVVGAFVITTAVVIFWNAVDQVFDLATGETETRPVRAVALWVALLTVVLKVVLTVLTRRISRCTGSLAVLALSRDHRNDVFSSAAAAGGIALARIGYPLVDPLAAALVALVILHTGVTIIRESSADLMLSLPDEQVADRIRQLLTAAPGVEQVEEIHVHSIGPYLLVDVTIGIDGTLTVAAGDEIASQVEATLWQQMEYVRRVSVHYHPSREAEQRPGWQ